MPRYHVILTAANVESCPLYEQGDRIVVNLPEVDMEATDKVCAFIIAQLLTTVLSQPKNLLCEMHENFANEKSYCQEFSLNQEMLYCPRVACEVSFAVEIAAIAEPMQDEELFITTNKQQMLNKLKEIPILSQVAWNDLHDLLPEIKIMQYQPGTVIIKKGQRGRHFFVISHGEVEVVQPFKEGVETIVGRLKTGECFGEMSLLTGEPVSATIRACVASSILAIDRATFRRLLEKTPAMGAMFTKLLSQRLKSTNQRMSTVVASGMAGQLQTISFPELIQTLCTTESSGILYINSHGQRGRVYFQNSEIIDATIANESGENCFYEMLHWQQGNFRFEHKEIERQRKIMGDAIGLLLEGMRRIDEENRSEGASYPGNVGLDLDGNFARENAENNPLELES